MQYKVLYFYLNHCFLAVCKFNESCEKVRNSQQGACVNSF